MDPSQQTLLIEKLLAAIEKRLPQYLANTEDFNIGRGNVAVCIIDEGWRVHGRMFGDNKIKQREIYGVAWKKASQVWITGIATYEYEKKVYAGEIDTNKFGIMHPELIGWEGGQPITLGGMKLAIGFSGMRGVNDLEIVTKAAEDVR
jgi:uncharacterized protein GlcG (DUF336 family)